MLNKEMKPVTRIYIHEDGNRGFVFHPDGLCGLTQPHKIRQTHTKAETQKWSEKRKSDGGKKLGSLRWFVCWNR